MNGPKLTEADIEAAIASEHYFTAFDGAVTNGEHEKYATGWEVPRSIQALELLTFCVLVLRNGHKIVGINYGPVSPENFNAEQGRQEARKHAIEQVWPLMGYALREKLARTENDHRMALKEIPHSIIADFVSEEPSILGLIEAASAPASKPLEPWQQRVIEEKAELDERLDKLRVFLNGLGATLPAAEQMRMYEQACIMERFSKVLGERIAAFK